MRDINNCYLLLSHDDVIATKVQKNKKANLFVKQNEQKKARFHFAMVRKGARKRTIRPSSFLILLSWSNINKYGSITNRVDKTQVIEETKINENRLMEKTDVY